MSATKSLQMNGVIESRSRKRASTWRRFRRHHLAVIGSAMLLTMVLCAVGAPVIAGESPTRTYVGSPRESPSSAHLLGTDDAGRDVLSRLLHAGRVSLSVGIVAVSIYTFIGIILGSAAGYFGGLVDSIVMRLADAFLAFPPLIVIIALVAILGPGIFNIMLAIGFLAWPPVARLLRGQLLSLRERDFVLASRAVGASGRRIIIHHLLPNAIAPIIVLATFGVAQAILLEAALSFLGLGVQPPTPSWGNMLNAAQSIVVLDSMPWLWVPPGVMIALAVLSINFVGDGLRDALDPYLSQR